VYRRKLVLYGCGDLIDDYEGIVGYEAFRDDLVLLYFVSLDDNGDLEALHMTPMQIRRMRLNRASPADTEWLRNTLCRISARFATRAELTATATLTLAPGL
jgi:poly-gamma-glutamate synthesis protein (capsule biosynthesis protein)